LVLFERTSELIAILLAGAVFIAMTVRVDQGLAPELRLETYENQFTGLWPADEPLPDIAPSVVLIFLVRASHALARAQ
jgi:hypothetical protein